MLFNKKTCRVIGFTWVISINHLWSDFYIKKRLFHEYLMYKELEVLAHENYKIILIKFYDGLKWMKTESLISALYWRWVKWTF